MSVIKIIPRDQKIGAEVTGIDLTEALQLDSFEILRNALDDHRLLIFRNLRWYRSKLHSVNASAH